MRRSSLSSTIPSIRPYSTWRVDEEDEATRVELELAEEEEGVRLRVVESRPLADPGRSLGIRGPQMTAASA